MTTQADEQAPLGRLIREQGRLKGWVAERMGIGYGRLSKLCDGTAVMTVEEAAAAAVALDVDVQTFIPAEVA